MLLDNRSRYEEIEQEVADLYEECATALTLPVNLKKICDINHYTLFAYSTLEESLQEYAYNESDDGFSVLTKFNGLYKYFIYYNDLGNSHERIRFTIAHEIGHIRLGHHENKEIPYEEAESEANHFAKYLLSPHPVSDKLHLSTPQDFKKTYMVSRQAAAYTKDSCDKRFMYGGWGYKKHEKTILEALGIE